MANKHSINHLNALGTRISLVPYFDPNSSLRKAILNGLRSGVSNQVATGRTGSVSSVSAVTNTDLDQYLFHHLGMGFDACRSTIFQRGSNSASFLAVASRLAGVTIVTKEDIIRACDALKEQLLGQLDGTYATVNDGVSDDFDAAKRYSAVDQELAAEG